MSQTEAGRLMQAVFRHIPSDQHRQAVVADLAHALEHDPTADRLPEARLVTEFLSQSRNGTAKASERLIASVSTYVLALVCDLSNTSDCTTLVSLCEENEAVSQKVHAALHDVLSRAESTLQNSETDLSASSQQLQPHPVQCLIFLTAYYRSLHQSLSRGNDELVLTVLAFLNHADRRLVQEASKMCVALIDCLDDPCQPPQAELPWLPSAWLKIWSFVDQSHSPSLRTAALMLWLRLYSKLRSRSILDNPGYWNPLHAILSGSTHEQQKLALTIFRVSISVFYGGRQQQELVQYSKYVTVYQAVVLDRYVNQVHESLADLALISRSGSGVSQRWLFALLQSALASTTQHSVRKLVGEWVMRTPELFTNERNIDSPALLQHAFLPWASMGSFFTSTIVRLDDGRMSCWHGENLAGLIAQILSHAETPQLLHRLLKAILAFVESQGRYIFGHGRAFILEGVASALEQSSVDIDVEELGLLSSIASIAGFLEIAMDYMASLCGTILAPRPVPTTLGQRLAVLRSQVNVETEEKLQKDCALLAKATTGIGTASEKGLDAVPFSQKPLGCLCSWIRTSTHKCLAGAGLLAGCGVLSYAVNNATDAELSPDELYLATRALWDETEVQDFPRGALMLLARVLIHPRVVAICQSPSSFSGLAKQLLSELGQIARGKVYVFSVLAEGWRNLARNCPDTLDVASLFGFIQAFALTPPDVKVEFDLEAVVAVKLAQRVPGRTYEFYYGRNEGFAHACVFDMLNTLPDEQSFRQPAKGVLFRMVLPWAQQKMPIPVYSDWKSTTQLQVMLMLLEYCLPHLSDEDVSHYLSSFFQVLEIELLPRYRFLFEWMIARVLYHKPSHRPTVLQKHSEMDVANPKLVISIIKLALMVASFPDTEASYASELAVQLSVLSTCPKIVIRHEAQWTFPQLWSLSEARGWSSVTDNVAFRRLDAQIRSLEAFRNPPHGRMQENLDPVEDTNLCTVVAGYYMQIEPREAPKALRRDFIAVTDMDSVNDMTPATRVLLPLGEAKKFQQRTKHGSSKKLEGSAQTASTTLQTKGNMSVDDMAKVPVSLLDASFPGSVRWRARPSPLVVVASLIDSHWNLGGLCRAAEILGAASMHIHSLSVVDGHAFTSVSVSSQSHLPIEQLPVSGMSAFLTAKKLDGFEVVGIEQTDNSKILGAAGEQGARFKPDGKTVLVLGSEREGLPGELLADCDWCVEVRQKGITRSMNVQTAAAVVMYEYTRQMQH